MNKKIIIFIIAAVSVSFSGCVKTEESQSTYFSSGSETSTSTTTSPQTTTQGTTTTTPDSTTTPESTTTQGTTTTKPLNDNKYGEEIIETLSKISYYKESNKAAYIEYKNKNPKMSDEEIVTYVNIGLNRNFYTNITEIKDTESYMVLVNKFRKLPSTYIPPDLVKLSDTYSYGGRELYLRKDAAAAFEQLCADANKAGYNIYGYSAYRSYSRQTEIYNNYKKTDGQAKADTYSARPGHSEHQTGLTIDVNNGTKSYTDFGLTADYKWAKDNIHKYGFIFSYPPNKEWITGYKTEEWQFRYVGVENAELLYKLGITLDEYYAKNP